MHRQPSRAERSGRMYKVVMHNPDGTTHEEDEIFETEEEARI